MCNPVAVIQVAAALYGGYSANQQARQQAKATEDTAEYNARINKNEAVKTRNKGVEEENRQRRITAELLGRQRAQLGASGTEVDSGSALQLQQDTIELGEADALRVRSNYDDQARALDSSADLTSIQADNEASSLRASGKSSLIGGALQAGASGYPAASKWYNTKSAANVTSGISSTSPNFNEAFG